MLKKHYCCCFKYILGFSQALFSNPTLVKCLMICPEGQHLLETDSPHGTVPTFLHFPGMREEQKWSEPGNNDKSPHVSLPSWRDNNCVNRMHWAVLVKTSKNCQIEVRSKSVNIATTWTRWEEGWTTKLYQLSCLWPQVRCPYNCLTWSCTEHQADNLS